MMGGSSYPSALPTRDCSGKMANSVNQSQFEADSRSGAPTTKAARSGTRSTWRNQDSINGETMSVWKKGTELFFSVPGEPGAVKSGAFMKFCDPNHAKVKREYSTELVPLPWIRELKEQVEGMVENRC
jgi:hypothetical protein